MSSGEANGFLVGGRYRNRQREYEVVDITGSQLRVMYDDGSEGLLDAETQARIIGNMERESMAFEPYQGAGASVQNRQYFRSLGFLASRITMMEAIVPPRAQRGFVQTYREITGTPPRDGAVGYYVHYEQVDKWGNELRITFDASVTELEGLDFGPNVEPVENPGNVGISWRINRNAFWWNLLGLGFSMGNYQEVNTIRQRIPHAYQNDFENGIRMAQH